MFKVGDKSTTWVISSKTQEFTVDNGETWTTSNDVAIAFLLTFNTSNKLFTTLIDTSTLPSTLGTLETLNKNTRNMCEIWN